MTHSGEALGVLEVSSIARGIVVADAMAKRAPIRILQTHPVSPGKHLVIVDGGVAEVEEAMGAGLAVASGTLVDRLFLPQAHPQLAPLIATGAGAAFAASPARPAELDSIGVFETFSVCATILAADAAAKAADVVLLDMRLAVGIGGKAFFTMTGTLDSVEAAAAAGRGVLESGLLVGVEIIAAPHADLRTRVIW